MTDSKELTKSAKSAKKFAVKVKRKINAEKHLLFWCFLCDQEIQVYRKDDNGDFIPQTICPHMAYKGVIE
jgi:hypothetical protein